MRERAAGPAPVLYAVAPCVVLIAVCWIKGEPPGRRRSGGKHR